MIKILMMLVLFSGCSTLKCFKKCGIFPDGCMSSCKRGIIAADYCGGEERVADYDYNSVECKR